MHLTLNVLLGRHEAAVLTAHGLPLGRLLCDGGASSGGASGKGTGAATTWRQLAEKGMVVQVGSSHKHQAPGAANPRLRQLLRPSLAACRLP